MTFILGIESSCDETACAVVEDGHTLHSNIIASQIDLHAQYGGVFPEPAGAVCQGDALGGFQIEHIQLFYDGRICGFDRRRLRLRQAIRRDQGQGQTDDYQ
jgi:hypothetical protein